MGVTYIFCAGDQNVGRHRAGRSRRTRRAGRRRWRRGTGSITALPYVSGTFDAVWCANVTEYLTDDELRQMLAEFRRVVRPGGMVAIKEWDNTRQLLLPGPPLLLMHLHEALLAGRRHVGAWAVPGCGDIAAAGGGGLPCNLRGQRMVPVERSA